MMTGLRCHSNSYMPLRGVSTTRHEWTRNQNEIGMSRSCAQIHREADTVHVCVRGEEGGGGGGGGLFWLVASKCLLYLFIYIQHNQCKRFFERVEYKSKLVMIDDYPLSLPHFPFTCSYACFQFVHTETWVGTAEIKNKKKVEISNVIMPGWSLMW